MPDIPIPGTDGHRSIGKEIQARKPHLRRPWIGLRRDNRIDRKGVLGKGFLGLGLEDLCPSSCIAADPTEQIQIANQIRIHCGNAALLTAWRFSTPDSKPLGLLACRNRNRQHPIADIPTQTLSLPHQTEVPLPGRPSPLGALFYSLQFRQLLIALGLAQVGDAQFDLLSMRSDVQHSGESILASPNA